MRRVTPVSRATVKYNRNLYIKQFQAVEILKEKAIPIREVASSLDMSVSITVDRTALSPCIVASPSPEIDPTRSRKFSFSYTQSKFDSSPLVDATAAHLGLPESSHSPLAALIQALWEIFKEKEAFVLETQIGTLADGNIEVRGAKFGFDDAAFRSSGRQEDIHKLRNPAEEVPEEVEAEKDGIVYVKYDHSTPWSIPADINDRQVAR